MIHPWNTGQRDELLTLAANSAQDSAQIDVVGKLKDLEAQGNILGTYYKGEFTPAE